LSGCLLRQKGEVSGRLIACGGGWESFGAVFCEKTALLTDVRNCVGIAGRLGSMYRTEFAGILPPKRGCFWRG